MRGRFRGKESERKREILGKRVKGGKKRGKETSKRRNEKRKERKEKEKKRVRRSCG